MLESGAIRINNIIIDKDTKKSEFKINFTGQIKDYLDLIYDFVNPVNIGGYNFWVGVAFTDEKINRIELKNAAPELKDTFDQNQNKIVELRKKSHDKFLVDNLGEPHYKNPSEFVYNFEFGEISSYYRPSKNETGIVIDYK